MIDFETLKFLGILNDLAEKSKIAIVPFSNVRSDHFDENDNYIEAQVYHNGKFIAVKECIIYDDANEITTDNTYIKVYPVISEMCLNPEHHDIISLYSNDYKCDINVIIDDDDDKILYVDIQHEKYNICIENGHWYFT